MLTGLTLFTRHLRGKGLLIAALCLLGLASAATSLASPLIGKSFIDSVVGKQNFALVPRIALALLGLAVADLILGTCTRQVHARLSAGVLVEIRERLFAQCLHAPLAEMERFRQGDLLNRFGSDIPKIQTLLVDGVLGFFQNLLFLVVAAAILLRLSAVLALWSFLGLVIALAITASFRRPVEQGTRRVRDAMVDLSHFLTERLGALRAVRLQGAQAEDRHAFAAHNATLVHRLLRFQTLDSAASGFPALALTASLAWIYLLGGRLIEGGTISLGTFVAFVLYQGRLVGPATGLLGLLRNIQEARVSLERVVELLAIDSIVTAPSPPGRTEPGGIVFEDVSFAYAGSPPVLNKLDLQVSPGERVAVFGISGEGKSTLVQLLFGLRTPHTGQISVGPAVADAQARLGYAGCDPFLLHATVAENLRYGNQGISDTELHLAASLAEAHRFISVLPDGYRTIIGGRGLALSDGQRQRIGLVRLILRNPAILVLDEAFSALDPETEAKIRQNLFSHFPDRTFLVITHRLHGLNEFDRLFLMKAGQLRQVDGQELSAELGGTAFRQAASNLVALDQVRTLRQSADRRP
ncbi:ABC transporter ATP-binding protein [Geobacter argillaceus]|uniref:ATP-binding cassette subfamily B protein n=1 Tax=Geobacter argillaceus TaxID=345631 RepID=A0A562VLR7_9BACT|nr:ABC transporter ATP-binding protein [Geobacter argillaceus]TWJ18731.1 ATP-binding cassette subfamily B protein [Geobacter argillaceus]